MCVGGDRVAGTPFVLDLFVNAHLRILEFDHGRKGLGSILKTVCQRNRVAF